MSKVYQVKVIYEFEMEIDEDTLSKEQLKEAAKEQFDEKLMNIDVDSESFEYIVN